jgi:hypothetical protein
MSTPIFLTVKLCRLGDSLIARRRKHGTGVEGSLNLRRPRQIGAAIGLSAGGRWIRTIGPRHERASLCCGRRIAGPNGGSQKGLSLMRYRWFESISLQRRVRCEPDLLFLGCWHFRPQAPVPVAQHSPAIPLLPDGQLLGGSPLSISSSDEDRPVIVSAISTGHTTSKRSNTVVATLELLQRFGHKVESRIRRRPRPGIKPPSQDAAG